MAIEGEAVLTQFANGDAIWGEQVPTDTSVREDLITACKAPVKRDGGKFPPAALFALSLHRFASNDAELTTKACTSLAKLAVVISGMFLDLGDTTPRVLSMTPSDTVITTPCAKVDGVEDNGKWQGKRNAVGEFLIGVGDLIEGAKLAISEINDDWEILTKVAIQIIIACAICLFKDNHHYTTDIAAKLMKILEGGGATVQLKRMGLDSSKESVRVGLHRTLVHPITMSDKWLVACKYARDLVFTCRLSGVGSGNAKAGIIAAIFRKAKVDKTLDVFLANVGGETTRNGLQLLDIVNNSTSPDVAVVYCTNSFALSGKDFVNLAHIVAGVDATCIMACIKYVGGTVAGQSTFGDQDYSEGAATSMAKDLTELAKLIVAVGTGDPAGVLKHLIKEAKAAEGEEDHPGIDINASMFDGNIEGAS